MEGNEDENINSYMAALAVSERLSDEAISAVSKALKAIELLEQILLEVWCVDITSAKRVSKLWRATIEMSSLIQKGCFMKSTTAHPMRLASVWAVSFKEHYAKALAERLEQYQDSSSLPATLETAPISLTLVTVIRHTSQGNIHIVNPLVELIIRLNDKTYRKNHSRIAAKLSILHADSAWTEMYVTQPPTTHVELRKDSRWDPDCSPLQQDIVIENTSGVTIHDLLRVTREFERRSRSYHWVPMEHAGLFRV